MKNWLSRRELTPKTEMKELSTRLADANKAALDHHFNHGHRDA